MLLNDAGERFSATAISWPLDGHPPTHISDSPSTACSPQALLPHRKEGETETRKGNPSFSALCFTG